MIRLCAPPLLILACAGLMAACLPAVEAPAGPPFQPTASLQDIMLHIVDPAADVLWESVGTVVTANGSEERRPRSDEDWLSLRHRAIALVEASNLLLIPGRDVTHGKKAVDDAHIPGVLSAAAVKERIVADPAAFNSQVLRLHRTAESALRAIDERKLDDLLVTGGQIQEACESCHVRFWYPGAQAPKN